MAADVFEPSGDFTFSKISFNGQKVRLEYAVKRHSEKTDERRDPEEYTLLSPDLPVQGFRDALQALAKDVVTICELDERDAGRIEVRTVSLTHKHGTLGACICGLKGLKTSNSPLVLNTPHLTETPYGEGGGPILPTGTVDRLHTLCDRAEAYVLGERLQPDLKDAETNRPMFPPGAEEGAAQ